MPLEGLVRAFNYYYDYMPFDPEWIMVNPEIPFAKSMPDYIMRWPRGSSTQISRRSSGS